MRDHAEFVLARLAETEAAARRAATIGASWEVARPHGALRIQTAEGGPITRDREGLSDSVDEDAAPHIALHDPDHVLADVEGKRWIVKGYLNARDMPGPNGVPLALIDPVHSMHVKMLRQCVAVFALPYAKHPDYRNQRVRV